MTHSILGSYLIIHESCLWLTHCICILGDVLSIDHTMRTAAKAVIIDKSHQHCRWENGSVYELPTELDFEVQNILSQQALS